MRYRAILEHHFLVHCGWDTSTKITRKQLDADSPYKLKDLVSEFLSTNHLGWSESYFRVETQMLPTDVCVPVNRDGLDNEEQEKLLSLRRYEKFLKLKEEFEGFEEEVVLCS